VSSLPTADSFIPRHLGPSEADQRAMLAALGVPTLDALIDATVPANIRFKRALALPAAMSEQDALAAFRQMMSHNEVWRSFLGMGYSTTHVPAVIQRNILENPGWYTAYTPYQAEIAQGRLEALLNYQTVVTDLTALPIATASLLDEGTAAAEAMQLVHAGQGRARYVPRRRRLPSADDRGRARARPCALGITVQVQPVDAFTLGANVCGVLVQYPNTTGAIQDHRALAQQVHDAGAMLVVATDLLALTLLTPPGEWGADVVHRQRAAIRRAVRLRRPARRILRHARRVQAPDAGPHHRRVEGCHRQARAAHGARHARAAHPPREGDEQHLHRAGAAGGHGRHVRGVARAAGPDRASRSACAATPARSPPALRKQGCTVVHERVLRHGACEARRRSHRGRREPRRRGASPINLRCLADGAVRVSLDETVTDTDLADSARRASATAATPSPTDLGTLGADHRFAARFTRSSAFIDAPGVQHVPRPRRRCCATCASSQSRDLSLAHSMIPLGSLHDEAQRAGRDVPGDVAGVRRAASVRAGRAGQGLHGAVRRCSSAGSPRSPASHAVSLQPNAGSQGEYAGLLVIRAYHRGARRGPPRHLPDPAVRARHQPRERGHGRDAGRASSTATPTATSTWPTSRPRPSSTAENLAALMVTYPSTHGVFEEAITDIMRIDPRARRSGVHGRREHERAWSACAAPATSAPTSATSTCTRRSASRTAAVARAWGRSASAEHLAPFLPAHPVVRHRAVRRPSVRCSGGAVGQRQYPADLWPCTSCIDGRRGPHARDQGRDPRAPTTSRRSSSTPTRCSTRARTASSRMSASSILRGLKAASGVDVEDIAKRLMDYGFHAPTISFPVAGTLMIEPTESEPKSEIDRFIEALISIRAEIDEIAAGKLPKDVNPLKSAPHTLEVTLANEWTRAYTRERAAFPLAWVRERKFWPSVSRVDNAFGDRNLVCACPPVEEYAHA
jgi:glycine dehydrogenase